ncbi:MAG: helix-turn-helix domain-containing protein [Gracilibacteraceae bacterium]|jgi:excisionase family DNA binding protein|nr:helix-turn-helix domain-containing protein [Gracilibacteraceae bacterium]
MTEERWLSVDEIAAHLGIKRDTVYSWINERQMPAHKIGRLWKFSRGEVDEWVRSGVRDKGDEIPNPDNS